MTPRLAGIIERRDAIFYDTNKLEPGQEVQFFDNKNVGDMFLTNLQVARELASDQTYVMLAIGVRLLGKTREQEDLLLDHLRVTINIGDIPRFTAVGPHVSMLRHIFSKEELERLEREDRQRFERHADESPRRAPPQRVGYHFARPIILPAGQLFYVEVEASKELPEAVTARVHIFGLQTRDVA